MMMIANKKFSMFENKEENDIRASVKVNGEHKTINYIDTMEVEGESEGDYNAVSIEFFDSETKDCDNETYFFINLDVDDARKLSYALQSCLDAIDWAEKQPNK